MRFYADDVVLFAETEEKLQAIMLDYFANWCHKWSDKTQIIHFRKTRATQTKFSFTFGTTDIKIVDSYRYLGVEINSNLNYKRSAEILSNAGGRALGCIIQKFKTFKDIGYKTYNQMYNRGVVPVMDYCSEFWGFVDYISSN